MSTSTHSDIGYYSHAVAKVCGIEAAAIYERLRFLITKADSKNVGRVIDGKRWVFFAVTELREEYLDWVSNDKALRKALTVLEGAKLLLTRSNGHGKWYTLGEVTPATLGAPSTEKQDAVGRKTAFPNRANRLPEVAEQITQAGEPDCPDRELAIYKELESTLESTSEATKETTFSSSPTAAATPPAVEEKEIISASPVLDLDQRLLDAFAKLVGVYTGSSEQTKAELAGGLRVILDHHPDVQPSHFRHFSEYHQEQNQNRKTGPRYALPKINYVVAGWEQFKAWWEPRSTESRWDVIPGTDNYLSMARCEWDELVDLQSSDEIQIRGRWVYRKQDDGTFVEVPESEWGEWVTRESA